MSNTQKKAFIKEVETDLGPDLAYLDVERLEAVRNMLRWRKKSTVMQQRIARCRAWSRTAG